MFGLPFLFGLHLGSMLPWFGHLNDGREWRHAAQGEAIQGFCDHVLFKGRISTSPADSVSGGMLTKEAFYMPITLVAPVPFMGMA